MTRAMNKGGLAALVLGAAALLVLFSSAFTVRESSQALVLQFGEPQRVLTEPGLYFKLPFIQDVRFFDKRVLDYDANAREIPTGDQKQVVVDAFARYRIVDPLLFHQTMNNEFRLQQRLDAVIDNALRDVLGDVELEAVLTPKRTGLMQAFTDKVAGQGNEFGIRVIDVRIKRIDLPEENSQAIFRRMQTQREQEARKFRAEGEKESRLIRAEVDKRLRVIVAEARRQAEIMRGEGDARAAEIYAEAYRRDPKFFDFWRSMQAMQKGLDPETTTWVGPPDGDFFRYLNQEGGGQ